MKYSVKEIYYTLQGEGAHTGRPAVFLRFAGCNLWTGREEDRHSAQCQFCDTDFIGMDGIFGGRYTASELSKVVDSLWPENSQNKYVVCTGGEPLLQLNETLVNEFHQIGFEIAIETNGTIPVPEGIDWICMSPKVKSSTVVTSGNELKLVFPQKDIKPEDFVNFDFDHFYLQPMDGVDRTRNTELTIEYCLQNPKWRLSLQSHKLIGIP